MAITPRSGTRPVNFRLPEWVIAYLAERAEMRRTTKTQVLVEAVDCLRERERAALMAEGYVDRGEDAVELAETALPAAAETLPEW